MATSTPRLQLLKPGDIENVDVDAQLNDNWDKLDNAAMNAAHYYQSVAQTGLANAAVTAVKFDVELRGAAFVTPNANRDVFTINKSGLYTITFGPRLQVGTISVEAEGIGSIGPTAGDNTVRWISDARRTVSNNAVIQGGGISTGSRPFNAGQTFSCNQVSQNGGIWQTAPVSQALFMNIKYDGPL